MIDVMREKIFPSRSTIVIFIWVLLIVVLGCQKKENDNRWVEVLHKIGESGQYTIYYDRKSIDCHEPRIIRFWVKQKYSSHSVLSHSLFLMAFNYKARTYRILDVIKYNRNDKALPPDPTTKALTSLTWTPVIANSECESIFIKLDQKEFGGLLEKIHAKR